VSRVECDGVSVHYADRCALDRFRNTVEPGEWVAVIGPNGAGKSSLLRALAGLVPTTGRLLVDGVELNRLSVRQRAQHVAYVAQEPVIPPDMTAFEYVLLGRWPYVGRFGQDSKADRDVVRQSMDRLGLDTFGDRLLGELSGGERQRVVLARALAQRAPVLLLDEPTSALDIGHQQQVLELVTEMRLHGELTVIAAMHDLTLAGLYSDRLVMLDEGQIVADGAAGDVLTAERIGEVYRVCVTVDVEPGGDVVVVPRSGFPTHHPPLLAHPARPPLR
jgi:iron complex transport system ATP-binding protein